MLVRGQRVDHRDRRPLRPRLELGVLVRAHGERVEVARERARRVGQRLAARELQLLRASARSPCRRAAPSRPRTRRACASSASRSRGRASRPGSSGCFGSLAQLDGEVEDRLGLRRREIGDPQQVAPGERDGGQHPHRSFAAATAARDVAEARRRRRRLERARRARSPRPARARRGTARRRGRAPRRRRSRAAADRTQRRRAARGRTRARRRAPSSAASAPRTSRRAREHRRLVLLQVAVVRERQPLHRREQPGEPADRGARLAARELGDVGVQLLRHHRRPRRRVLGQPREAELRASSRGTSSSPIRERCVKSTAHGVEVVEREVAVGDGVERVAHRVRRRRQRQRRAGERARAERRRLRLRAARTRSARGRARASPTHASRWWPSVTGCARCRCV